MFTFNAVPQVLCLSLWTYYFELCLIFLTHLLFKLICLILVPGTKLAKTAVGRGGVHRILHQGKNDSFPQKCSKTHYHSSVSKLRSIISCLQMDPKSLEALPTEKATKMELKRGQVVFHQSATKFQQRYRIQLNSIKLMKSKKHVYCVRDRLTWWWIKDTQLNLDPKSMLIMQKSPRQSDMVMIQAEFHDAFILHHSNPNKSKDQRRCAFIARYFSSTKTCESFNSHSFTFQIHPRLRQDPC